MGREVRIVLCQQGIIRTLKRTCRKRLLDWPVARFGLPACSCQPHTACRRRTGSPGFLVRENNEIFAPLAAMKTSSRKKRHAYTLARPDKVLEDLVESTGKKILAAWAIDCTLRVLPFFEEHFPGDTRPREALDVLREWIRTGTFHMAVIRGASLAAHAAARDAGEDSPARSAARAAGQAVATAHVARHSLGAALYAQQAVWRNALPEEAETAAADERDWQYRHLRELREEAGREN